MATVNRWFYILIVLALLSVTCRANTNVRNWKLQTGESFSAELMSYEESTGVVHLRIDESVDREFQSKSFSLPDQAWLKEWKHIADEMEALRKKLGGTVSFHQSTGPLGTGFYVYRPSKTKPDQKLPLFILFEPGGNARRFLMRFIEAAESTRCSIVCCDTFRNTKDNPDIEAEMLERFRLLLPLIEKTVTHDPQQVFLGGASGGAWRAYHYVTQVSRPWAGIFANGGWLGGWKYYNLPYPPKLRVAMVNGDRDIGANHWVDTDSDLLTKCGDTVTVMSFEGAHQIPPASVQIKAFNWLLGRPEVNPDGWKKWQSYLVGFLSLVACAVVWACTLRFRAKYSKQR
ncbi:MAG: hypothetical protein WCO68_00150 [Verrucomicrobiota bacterium]